MAQSTLKLGAIEPLKESELLDRLRQRFAPPEWSFFDKVRNAAGFDAARVADAIAMNTWPSRGLTLAGFEVKSNRGDWLREKADPTKAEAIAQFCDQWWLVVGHPEIVRAGELPPKWGLLVPRGKGLVIAVDAPELKPVPLSRDLLAVLLRRAQELVTAAEKANVGEAVRRAVDAERMRWAAAAEKDKYRGNEHAARLDKMVATFEAAAGVKIENWSAGDVGAAVKRVLRGDAAAARLEGLRREVTSIGKLIDGALGREG